MNRLFVLGLAAVLLGTTPTPAAEAAEPDHLVHAGAIDPTDQLSAHLYEGYFPRDIRVHRGDRVRWEFPNQANGAQAFHTVTFGDSDAATFVRADELPGMIAFDERTFFTTGCGRTGQPVCVISSPDQFVSSGTPIQHADSVGAVHPFDAVIDLPEGIYTYFCTIHHPAMQGTVEVVDDGTQVDNPRPEDFADQIAALTEHADATYATLSEPAFAIEGDHRLFTVNAGASTDTSGGAVRVSTETFLPSSLQIEAGDRVRWVMAGTAHTVTFPDTTQGQGPPQHFTLNCEFDEPAGGAPGVPEIAVVAAAGLPWCPPGGTAEMSMTPLASQQRAPEDAVVSPATLHNSGIMITGSLPERLRGRPPGSGEFFPSQFEATFPVPGTYTYRCLFHWTFMVGSITVVGA